MERRLAAPSYDRIASLPTFDGILPPPRHTLFSSFRILSLLQSYQTSGATPPEPSDRLLEPLRSAFKQLGSTAEQLAKVQMDLNAYLTQVKVYFRDRTKEDVSSKDLGFMAGALWGYSAAFSVTSRQAWREGEAKSEERNKTGRFLETALAGALALYRHISMIASNSGRALSSEEQVRESILASIFPRNGNHPNDHFAPLFDRARHLARTLQVAYRPLAHSKGAARAPVTASPQVTDEDASEIMRLLDIFAEGVEKCEKLHRACDSNVAATTERDRMRPQRVSMDARMLSCEIAMIMANHNIKDIRRRAQAAHFRNVDQEDDEGDKDEDDDNERTHAVEESGLHDVSVKWEEEAELLLIQALQKAKNLVEVRRGAVLTAHVEPSEWLSPEMARGSFASTPSVDGSTSTDPDDEQGERDQDTDVEDGSSGDETGEGEDDFAEVYPCPLRALFRLHDQYEEQRLAVWLTLPASTRLGMGTYMRGEQGAMGEAWDALGLLLLLDHDSDSLSKFGLSVDNLDKWVDLASRRNSKKIRRESRRAV